MSEPQKPAPAAKPRYKKKGPIRFEAILPFAIVTGLVVAYVVLFLDMHLKAALEWGASRANGAEVNVRSLRTRFLTPDLRIDRIEVTDPGRPDRNRFEIGQIEFRLLWDALLRGKAVVELAEVADIQVNTQRARPGRLYPSEENSGFLTGVKEKISDSALGSVAQLLDGFDPAKDLKDVGNLKSAARVQELQSELSAKEKEWSSMLQTVPGQKELAAVEARIAALKVGGTNNPAELASQVKQAESVVNEARAQAGAVQAKAAGLQGDVTGFGGKLGQIDDLVRQDRRDIEGKLKLPKLDTASLSEQLFGDMIHGQLGQVEKYVALARAKMPPKSKESKAEKQVVIRPRGEGRIYEFGRPNSYPRFWLKRAVISSKLQNTEFGGDVEGEILNVCSNQPQLGLPTTAELRGTFPKQRVDGVVLRGVMDHRGEVPNDGLELSVASFPVVDRVISGSDQLKIAFASAIGSLRLSATLRGEAIKIKAGSEFRQVDYRISSPNRLLESTVQGVVKSVPNVTVDAEVGGTLKDFTLAISSNLGAALARGFAGMLQGKVAEARQKIEGLIDAKVGEQKKQLTARYDQASKQLNGQIEARKKQAEEVSGRATARLDQAKQQMSKGAQQKGLDAVKKKLPFGR